MARRLAAATSLLAFAVCLLAGMAAQNTLATTLSRALVAMIGTLVIGLVVGAMGRRMLEENVAAAQAKAAREADERRQAEAERKQAEAAQKASQRGATTAQPAPAPAAPARAKKS